MTVYASVIFIFPLIDPKSNKKATASQNENQKAH